MNLRQLRYFVGIVQTGSLSRAAEQLHVAQSALSHHLASLEQELDRQLVVRGPKGIALTEAGSALYRHAEAILRQVESAKRDAMNAPNLPCGRVAIGFPVDWAGLFGFALFARMRRDYPQVLLHIVDGKSALLREHLLNGRFDAAVLFVDRPERGLAVEPLVLEELFYISADQDTSAIPLADVAQRPLLVPGPGSGTQRAAQHLFTEHGLTVTPVGEIDSLSAFRHAIASGIANGILPWAALYDGGREITLNYRRIADAKLTRPAALCFSEVAQRSLAVEAVAHTLKDLVRELIESGTWQGALTIPPMAQAPPMAPAEELSGSPTPP
ncbi:MAG TPA: LysR substrate-binding domain-containing protein [Xanthobacteraceae bacterium]|jgi:LysR family nitrogen assimilation transcriptional regulator|nr:LysR substrate-binding domain-containing protein [Xanthobacteraceae bacterium]